MVILDTNAWTKLRPSGIWQDDTVKACTNGLAQGENVVVTNKQMSLNIQEAAGAVQFWWCATHERKNGTSLPIHESRKSSEDTRAETRRKRVDENRDRVGTRMGCH